VQDDMDFIFDYIHVNTFWTILLIAHGLASVALLGAITHQAMAVLRPIRAGEPDGFVRRFRGVGPARYADAVCLLWLVVFVFGAWIYSQYRMQVRIPLEQDGFLRTLGAFELKEHLVSFGLAALPLYRLLWSTTGDATSQAARKWLTLWLAFVVWLAFLVGHVVNNARGFGT
jgi:hypothetical protein